jgi:hypothetical protein
MSTFGRALASFALALLPLSGCLEQAVGGPGGGNMQQQQEPPGDNRGSVLGIACVATLSISGQFTLGLAQPADIFGCWPVGTWKFAAKVESSDCQEAPKLESQYSLTVGWDATLEEYTYKYDNDPTYQRVRLKVSSGGGGLCEGGVTVYSQDGKVVTNLKPALQADNTINGNGEYEIFTSDQW